MKAVLETKDFNLYERAVPNEVSREFIRQCLTKRQEAELEGADLFH